MTIEENEVPARRGSPPRALHGQDILGVQFHARDRKPTLEVMLAGGEVLLVDHAAWKLLACTYLCLHPYPEVLP